MLLSTFQVLGSSHEYHFVHHGLPHARKKRSVGHLRLLKADPHIAEAVQVRRFRKLSYVICSKSVKTLVLTVESFCTNYCDFIML